jgi:DNA-binding MarR family transcriptional regulator
MDRLELRGLITRGAPESDRRVVLTEFTDAGRDTAATIRQTISDIETRALGVLSAAKIAGLRAGLLALTKPSR